MQQLGLDTHAPLHLMCRPNKNMGRVGFESFRACGKWPLSSHPIAVKRQVPWSESHIREPRVENKPGLDHELATGFVYKAYVVAL